MTNTTPEATTPDADELDDCTESVAGRHDRPLTDRQKRFVEAYLIEPTAAAAAREAGYAKRNAHRIGAQLLDKPHIAHAIRVAQAERAARTQVTADYVVEALKEVADRCLQRKPVMEWSAETRSLQQKRDENGQHVWQFDSVGANRALELLGKHLPDFFTTKQAAGATVQIQVQGVARAIIAAAAPPALPAEASSVNSEQVVDAEFVSEQGQQS